MVSPSSRSRAVPAPSRGSCSPVARAPLALGGTSLVVASVLVLAGTGCGTSDIAGAEARVTVDTRTVNFGNTLVGTTATRAVEVFNEGRQTAQVDVTSEAPFSLDRTRFEVPGGESRTFEVRFSPTSGVSSKGTLQIVAGAQTFEVELSGLGIVGQECESSHPCRVAYFDVDTVRCEETLLDDTPCRNECLIDPVCKNGECVGEVRDCGVTSQCRSGTCDPEQGCVVVESPQALCPVPTNPCVVPSCTEDERCAEAPVADGVACGPASCDGAFVCESGVCVEKAVAGNCPQTPLCTHDGWCWENPLPQGARLNAVSRSGSQLWAVGDGGVALRFVNDAWTLARTGTTHDLQSVHATESGAWVVGKSGTVLRWLNGAFLKIEAPMASLEFTSVWVAGEDEAFVASSDGRVWRRVEGAWVVDRSSTGIPRPKIAGGGVDDLWMLGRGEAARTLYRRTQTGWVSAWSNAEAALQDLVSLDGGGVAVVGLQWDGFQQRQFVFATDGDSLESVAAPPLPTPSASFLTGDSLDALWTSGRFGQVRRFDGEAWTELESGQSQQLLAAHVVGDTGWAVGEGGALAQVDSESWAGVSSRSDARPQLLRSVWADSSGDAWVVGSRGQVLRSSGKRWFRVSAPTSNTLRGVYGTGAGDTLDLWAVGDGGLVLRWNGKNFLDQKLPASSTLHAVWSFGKDRAWVVGDGGTAYFFDGTNWADRGQGLGGRINDVAGRSASDVWIAGDQGLWHWNGGLLTAVEGPTDKPILSLGVSGGALYVLVDRGGSQTTVYRQDAGAWAALPDVPMPRGTRRPLRRIHAAGDNALWAVGDDGVFFWNGSDWAHHSATNGLYDVFARPESGALVVGEQGYILRRD